MPCLLLGSPVPDGNCLFKCLAALAASCVAAGFAEGLPGTDQRMLRFASGFRYPSAFCPVFLYAFLRRGLCTAANRWRNKRTQPCRLFERKVSANCIQFSAKLRTGLAIRILSSDCDTHFPHSSQEYAK